MMEVSSVGAENKLGVDFADLYRNSGLAGCVQSGLSSIYFIINK